MPDEPIAVVLAGSDASGRSAVLGTLLGRTRPVVEAPPGGYVVVRYGRAGRPEVVPTPDVPDRPPRRIDVLLADPLLRHLTLIDAPAADRLGVAGTRVLVDVAGRAGATVYTVRSGHRVAPDEVAVLISLVHAGVAVFFALTPDRAGRWGVPVTRGRRLGAAAPVDPVEAYREIIGGLVPALSDAPWYAVDPPAADAALLRRALIDWAAGEALRRAADIPPVPAGVIRVPAGAAGSQWRARLDRVHRGTGYAVRYYLGVELANLHLRCALHLDRYDDPGGGLARVLDDELHALSLHTDVVADQAMAQMLDEVLRAIFADAVPRGAGSGLAAAVRHRIAADDSARALLVTASGALVAMPGLAAVTALRAYPGSADPPVLPVTEVALAGECWAPWQRLDASQALSRVHRTVEELEGALPVEVGRRSDAVRQAVRRLVGQAVHAGILAC
jgi:hypothetical protein